MCDSATTDKRKHWRAEFKYSPHRYSTNLLPTPTRCNMIKDRIAHLLPRPPIACTSPRHPPTVSSPPHTPTKTAAVTNQSVERSCHHWQVGDHPAFPTLRCGMPRCSSVLIALTKASQDAVQRYQSCNLFQDPPSNWVFNTQATIDLTIYKLVAFQYPLRARLFLRITDTGICNIFLRFTVVYVHCSKG